MNSCLSFLEQETPEQRVLEWLKHCSAAPKDVECCRVDSGGRENESTDSELTANVHLRNKSCVLNVQHSTKRQNESSTNQNNHTKGKHPKSSETDSGCLTSSTFLRLYSREESLRIIRYIVENDGFPFLKGTLLWQKMENEKVCCRSWQSMKEQFIKKIYPNLGDYPVKHDDKEKFMEYMKPSSPQKIIHMEPGQRGWRKNGKYYTIEEDIIILKYIFRRRRHLQVHGNSLWQTMEGRQILPGRTWQSMRSRYLNVIRHSLDEYTSKYPGIKFLNLNEKRSRLKKKSKVNVQSPLSSCSSTKKLVSRKASNQDIRKYAISTGTQLASKLKVFGKNREQLKNPNKEIQQTSCSLVHHEASDNETPALDQQNTFERNEINNDINRKVECYISCNNSSVVPDLQKADASTKEPVDKSDKANKKSDENDRSDENSRSGLNSQDCSSISSASQKRTVKDIQTISKNQSSKNCENSRNEGRNECTIPDQVSDLQESVSESEICDMTTSCNTNHTRSEGQVIDNETGHEISEGSFCSETTMRHNCQNLCVNTTIKNCVQCSSDHKLSPSSN